MKSIYLFSLATLAPLFDRPGLKFANQPVRIFLISFFLPVLGMYLKASRGLNSNFRLLCRHSVLDAGTYNVFYSDLDLTALLSQDQIQRAPEIASFIDRLRTFLPFLGELEIYTTEEHIELQKQIESHSKFYQPIRRIRKISWISDEAPSLPSTYHSAKRKRALKIIFKKLNVQGNIGEPLDLLPIQNFLQNRLLSEFSSTIDSDLEFCLDVPYLGMRLHCGDTSDVGLPRILELSPRAGLYLLATLPFDPEGTSVKSEINRLRLQPEIRQEWRAQVTIEVLTLAGVFRARPKIFPEFPETVRRLNSWL